MQLLCINILFFLLLVNRHSLLLTGTACFVTVIDGFSTVIDGFAKKKLKAVSEPS